MAQVDLQNEELDLKEAQANLAGVVGINTQTDNTDAQRARLVGLALAVAPGRACYVPLRHAGPLKVQFDRASR